MTSPVQTIIAKLQAANTKAAYAHVEAELTAKVEANRAAGPGNARLMREKVLREVHAVIKRLNPHVANAIKYEPVKFFVREPAKSDYNDEWVQQSGWTHASFECKYAYLSFNFDVEQRGKSRYSTNYTKTGKNYLTIGSYGDKKRFKELKDETWNYTAIAVEIIYRVEAGMQRAARDNRLERNKNAVAEVRAATGQKQDGYAYYVKVSNTADMDKPVSVNVTWSRQMTVEEAIVFVNALKELGIEN